MDYTKFTKDGPTASVETISFDEKIYWVSALVDALRDNSKELLDLTAAGGNPTSDRLAESLVARYAKLRAEATALLPEDEAAKLTHWTADLPDRAGVDEVFEATANLARCIDVVIQLPVFVASRVSQRMEIHGVMTKAGVDFGAQDATPTKTGAVGQYL